MIEVIYSGYLCPEFAGQADFVSGTKGDDVIQKLTEMTGLSKKVLMSAHVLTINGELLNENTVINEKHKTIRILPLGVGG